MKVYVTCPVSRPPELRGDDGTGLLHCVASHDPAAGHMTDLHCLDAVAHDDRYFTLSPPRT